MCLNVVSFTPGPGGGLAVCSANRNCWQLLPPVRELPPSDITMWLLGKVLSTFLPSFSSPLLSGLTTSIVWPSYCVFPSANRCVYRPLILRTGQNISRASIMHQQALDGCTDVLSSCFLAYLVLRVSKQVGRYLSNKMVRLALSVWTSLWSIQLLTGGFHPRSAGLMYRIPECTGNMVK